MSPQNRDVIRLRHMIDAAGKAVAFVRGESRGALNTDEKLSLALVRLVEILGEAASKVTATTQNRYPGIPWGDIIGTRNRLIHGYDSVNLDILWQIATVDLPLLIPRLQEALDNESPSKQGKLL